MSRFSEALDHSAADRGFRSRAPTSKGASGTIATAALVGMGTDGVQKNTANAANAIPADAKRRAEPIP